MFALVKNNSVIAVDKFRDALAPELEFHGGQILEVAELLLPDDHIISGSVSYIINGNIVNQVAQTEYAYSNYAEARKLHYPPIEDYLDGVVKGDQSQIDDYISRCQAVKTRFPKP
jgi:hypothetical protein